MALNDAAADALLPVVLLSCTPAPNPKPGSASCATHTAKVTLHGDESFTDEERAEIRSIATSQNRRRTTPPPKSQAPRSREPRFARHESWRNRLGCSP